MHKKHLLLALAGAAALYGSSAMACTTQNWADNGAVLGTVVAGQPDTDGVRRYSGFCGAEMNMNDGTAPGLRNDSPAAEPRYIGRFYGFFDAATGTFDVFLGRDSGNGEQFAVSYNSAAGTLTGSAAGVSTAAVAVGTGWHSVEIDWQQGVGGPNGTFDMSIDGAPNVSLNGLNNNGATIDHIILGDADGAGGGLLNVDAFESHRSTAVGRLLVGDANDDAGVNAGDIVVVRNEILANGLGSGQPDCNEDGGVNAGDVVCVRNVILGP